MTTLATTLPELDALLPRVRGLLAAVLERRQRVLEAARLAARTFARRAAGARDLLAQVAQAVRELEAQGRAEDHALAAALAALAEEMREQVQSMAATEAEVRSRLDALEGGADALRDELALLVPSSAAAWAPVERGAQSIRDGLRALAAELPALTEEAAVDAHEVAAVAGRKQQELTEEWDAARAALEAAHGTRSAGLEGCAARLGEAVERHGIELETDTIERLEGPGTQLAEQIAQRLAAEVEEPLRAALDAALLVVGQAAMDEEQTASGLDAACAELAAAAAAVHDLLPATRAQIAAARTAAEQVNVEWRR